MATTKSGETIKNQAGIIQLGADRNQKLAVIPVKDPIIDNQNTRSMIDLLTSIDITLKLLLTNMELMRSS